MTVFGAYAHYYNLLYRDKDYTGEVEYLDGLIRRHLPSAGSVLDLGCGTGRHALLLAGRGYRVTGVDVSEEMLRTARAQAVSATSFHQGDIRTIRLGENFDVVVSLFHVISYQSGNADLAAAFATVREHLRPGGIFIFDCWYGPAVLSDPPVVRVKRLEDEEVRIVRIAEPVLHPNENLVDVNYQVMVCHTGTGVTEELRETHRMRYLFLPELEAMLRQAGLHLDGAFEWMTGNTPGVDTWGVCCVVRG
ncbi:class I SAM-dependent methyltransferase [Geomonas oryzisoli]|uniref:Class I SAM-dependent methyltransferase n=1 Tax=Geomonas oryzisoli TaxID=2847992 RepID=A0ABX8J9G1_9BACT|nr:class I SAM-dependent methyltransferase [Geomonas oryzisoli]QWV95078.1 class I SAM-dependent methyltransferase [Geomonas oryzisoli]